MSAPRRDFGVVLAAAGSGSRFGARKQLLELAGRPVIHYSLDAFAACDAVAEIVVVAGGADLDALRELLAAWRGERPAAGGTIGLQLIEGGARRQDSVRRGLAALPAAVEYVLVHDAARPLLRPADVESMVEATRRHGAAVLGTPCHDSVKRVRGGEIVDELPRAEVWTVQTPQAGRVLDLGAAYERAGEQEMTDEASALRALGIRVALVEGSRDNIKITRPGDEVLAEALLRARRA
jgi:2-C-methyl-D-erythritol 4-phosphate cytidylyltransferase